MADEEIVAATEGEAKPALSVSAAMGLAKGALESVVVRLVGEVSEVNDKPGYKAVYFTVKDEKAALPCMMWMNRYQAAGVSLAVGALVEMTGRFSLYAAKGRMSFDVFTIALAGEGQLRLQVANLARELEAMGLMAPERKRPLPAYPQTVGIVTSPRGSVIHDMLRTLRRRYPLAKVLVAGVPVEGSGAADAMVDGLAKVVFGGAELVLLGRGGGSFEDLMPFNDRRLARTIAACPVPVVTGLGRSMELRLTGAARSVERIAALSLFREPERLFDGEALALDDLAGRLSRALPAMLREDRHRVGLLAEGLARMLPSALAAPGAAVAASRDRLAVRGTTLTDRFAGQLAADRQRLLGAAEHMADPFRSALSVSAARLHDLSPLTVLARGYAIARDGEGAVVRSTAQVEPGAPLTVTVTDGAIDCVVEKTR